MEDRIKKQYIVTVEAFAEYPADLDIMANTLTKHGFVTKVEPASPPSILDEAKEHKCKYCGVMTTQSDEECYKKPASSHSMPDVKRYDWFRTNVEMTEQKDGDYIKYSDYKLMRSQCDGLIKQKAVEFAEWVVEVTDTGGKYEDFNTDLFTKLTTEELYEIFNQQER